MSNKIKFGIGLVCLVVILGWVRSCRSGAGKPAVVGMPPVPVVAGRVVQKDVPIYLDGLGTVQAFNSVTIHVRVDGELKKVVFTEGQDVKAGDVLAQRAAMRLHGESVKRLIEGFSETIRREQIKGEVWQEARQTIGDFHANMRSLLDHAPRSLAQRCNPADPATAEAVLSEWLETQFYPTLSGTPATSATTGDQTK